MRTPTTIRVDDDLSASQASITLGAANDEPSRRLNLRKNKNELTFFSRKPKGPYMIDSPVIKEIIGDNLLDDLFQDLFPEVLRRDLLSVLCGNDDGVYTQRDSRAAVLLVLDRDLSLRIRAEPREKPRAACRGQCRIELVGERNGKRHILRCLVGGITKHNALVTRAMILERAMVKALGNIGRLLLDGNEDVASLVVKALVRIVVADVLDGISDNFLVVELSLGRDLAEDHDHPCLSCRLAGDLRRGVLFKASIELHNSLKTMINNYYSQVDSLWHLRPGHRSCLGYL